MLGAEKDQISWGGGWSSLSSHSHLGVAAIPLHAIQLAYLVGIAAHVAGPAHHVLQVALTLLTTGVPRCSMSNRSTLLSIRATLSMMWQDMFSSWTGAKCCASRYGVACYPTTGCIADHSLHSKANGTVMAPVWSAPHQGSCPGACLGSGI